MAWRFPDVLPVNGDILHTSHWNNNIDSFSSELNGFLDGDNLKKKTISRSMVKRNTFVRVFFSKYGDTDGPNVAPTNDFDIPMRTTAWSSVDTSTDGDEMPAVEFAADTDGWVECDFHASYQWTEPADPAGGSQAWFKFDEETNIFWHSMTTDKPQTHEAAGLTNTPKVVQRDFTTEFKRRWDDHATDPVWAKPTIGGLFFYASGGPAIKGKYFNCGFVEEPKDTDCVAFRVVVDGITVAETGWLSIGMYRNGVYLTGAAPVSAGRHSIKTEVRAARVGKMLTTEGALRDEGSGELTKVNPVAEVTARVPHTASHCRVRARALTVVFRKR